MSTKKTTIKKEFSFESESITEFVHRAQRAGMEQSEGIEAGEHIFEHFAPEGLGEAGYLTAYGVNVYPVGQTDKLKQAEKMPLYLRLHPELVPGAPKPAAYAEDAAYLEGITVHDAK